MNEILHLSLAKGIDAHRAELLIGLVAIEVYDQTMTDPIAPSLHKTHLIICLLHVVIYKLYPQEKSRPSPPELANCRCTTHFDETARRFGITKKPKPKSRTWGRL